MYKNQQEIKSFFPSLYALIGQTHMKHQLPDIFKKLCKNIYSTNKETLIMAFSYLLSGMFFSQPRWYVTLQVVIGDLVSSLSVGHSESRRMTDEIGISPERPIHFECN